DGARVRAAGDDALERLLRIDAYRLRSVEMRTVAELSHQILAPAVDFSVGRQRAGVSESGGNCDIAVIRLDGTRQRNVSRRACGSRQVSHTPAIGPTFGS